MPSSAIQVLWPCLSPCGVRPGLMGSQQTSGISSGMAWIPRPQGGVYAAPGWACDQAATGTPGQVVASAMTRRAGRLDVTWWRPGSGVMRVRVEGETGLGEEAVDKSGPVLLKRLARSAG